MNLKKLAKNKSVQFKETLNSHPLTIKPDGICHCPEPDLKCIKCGGKFIITNKEKGGNLNEENHNI